MTLFRCFQALKLLPADGAWKILSNALFFMSNGGLELELWSILCPHFFGGGCSFREPTRGGCRPPCTPHPGARPPDPQGASRPWDILARFMSLCGLITMSSGHDICMYYDHSISSVSDKRATNDNNCWDARETHHNVGTKPSIARAPELRWR